MKDPAETRLSPDTLIRIAFLAGLLAWSAMIIAPFIYIVIWGIIIAISTYPVFEPINRMLGGKDRRTAILLMITGAILVTVPGYLLLNNVIHTASELKAAYDSDALHIPPPPESVAEWPVIGKTVYEIWELTAKNITGVIDKYPDQSLAVLKWLGTNIGFLGFGLFQFLCSILVAGVLLMYNKEARVFSNAFFTKVMRERGALFASIAEKTIRNVSRGIIGVAFIQSAGAGIGFFAAGIPYAGLLTLACLVLCIVQLGVFLVAIPVLVYSYSTQDTLSATLLTVWCIIVMFSDNFLKPFFLGKGSPVPTAVVFIGSIGGFILSGIIGLFIGAVILALVYRLLMAWVQDEQVS